MAQLHSKSNSSWIMGANNRDEKKKNDMSQIEEIDIEERKRK